MNHRPEIDGLRAFAAVPVILYHAGVAALPGGFLGVDVFFVISGFLITGLLQQSLQQNRFSLQQFYARRARRILPALCVVMLACVPVAFLTMLPSQYEEFARSMPAVLLFVSNLFFWRESGYFAAAAAEKPLLHTWSLGVEEQFYFAFPLVLLALWRWRKNLIKPLLILSALMSLAAAEYASRYAINANFFFITSRAWELLAGALLVYLPKPRAGTTKNVLSLLGLALLVGSMFAYDDQMRLPSALTLPVVLATMLVLRYGTQGSIACKILRLRVCVAIGLISYSAYLWHQPLFAFARIYCTGRPADFIMLGLIALSFALAALSWKYVEQPFRMQHHPAYINNAVALRLLAIVCGILLLASAHGYLSHGRADAWMQRATPEQARALTLVYNARNTFAVYDNGECIFHQNGLNAAIVARIMACHQKYGPGVAIIGDSHAINAFGALRQHSGKERFILGFGQGRCYPYQNLRICAYDPFAALLSRKPGLFHDVIYAQAGFHLLNDAQGRTPDRTALSDVPLNAAMPDFQFNRAAIQHVAQYLQSLSIHTRVTWLGPHIEPQISEAVIVQNGCNHPFSLRTNQAEIYTRLEKEIESALQKTNIRYQSQMRHIALSLPRDFMDCTTLYWRDEDHYSVEGEAYFAKRLTLAHVLEATAHE